jgi:hypothetical protein
VARRLRKRMPDVPLIAGLSVIRTTRILTAPKRPSASSPPIFNRLLPTRSTHDAFETAERFSSTVRQGEEEAVADWMTIAPQDFQCLLYSVREHILTITQST